MGKEALAIPFTYTLESSRRLYFANRSAMEDYSGNYIAVLQAGCSESGVELTGDCLCLIVSIFAEIGICVHTELARSYNHPLLYRAFFLS